jgi:hypothetical protein
MAQVPVSDRNRLHREKLGLERSGPFFSSGETVLALLLVECQAESGHERAEYKSFEMER